MEVLSQIKCLHFDLTLSSENRDVQDPLSPAALQFADSKEACLNFFMHNQNPVSRSLSSGSHLGLALLFLFIFNAGCGAKNHELAIQTPDEQKTDHGNGSEKTSFDVPPLFSESQLKIGQWIEWQSTNSNGTTNCMRWKIIGSTASGIALESRSARKCAAYDDSHIELIKFNPDRNGLITMHTISEDGVVIDQKGYLIGKSIFDFLYGYTDKVDFTLGQWTLGTDQFAVFKLKNRFYYNKPGHPFHAFMLTFKDADSHAYQYKQSDPALEALPKDP